MTYGYPGSAYYSSLLEVLEFAPTQDLTVLETAKEELGIPPEDTSQDAKLTRWIHEASGEINAYCDRVLGRETVKETFTLDWQGQLGPLPLRRWPIAFIDSVTENTFALTVDNYRYAINGLLHRCYGRWFGEVVVQYQAGYQLLGELPYDLERSCLLLLRYRHSVGQRDPMVRSESVPGVYETTYWVGNVPGSDSSLPPDVTRLLTPYKDVAI